MVMNESDLPQHCTPEDGGAGDLRRAPPVGLVGVKNIFVDRSIAAAIQHISPFLPQSRRQVRAKQGASTQAMAFLAELVTHYSSRTPAQSDHFLL